MSPDADDLTRASSSDGLGRASLGFVGDGDRGSLSRSDAQQDACLFCGVSDGSYTVKWLQDGYEIKISGEIPLEDDFRKVAESLSHAGQK